MKNSHIKINVLINKINIYHTLIKRLNNIIFFMHTNYTILLNLTMGNKHTYHFINLHINYFIEYIYNLT